MKQLLLLLSCAAVLLAGDATGKWTGTLTASGPDGEQTHAALLVLKQDGARLTGTAGPDVGEQHEIQNGKIENGKLTFDLATGEAVMKFNLKLEGDEISGQITREREGQTETAKLTAKRDK